MTHSSNHWNSFHLCSRRKKGLHLSVDLDINRFNTTIIPVSFCTSFGFRGGYKLLMALIWSGFTSIPLWVTIYPRNFPDPTPKEHLDAFKAIYVSPGFQKCSQDLLGVRTPFCSSQPYHRYRPRHFFLTTVQTFLSSPVDKLILHFSGQKALLYSSSSHRSDESCFFLIICCQRYLMISLKGVQKTHLWMTYCCVY